MSPSTAPRSSRRDVPEAARREQARAAQLEAEFLRRHGVREFKNAPRGVLALLRSAGAPSDRAIRVRDRIGSWGAHGGPFDHGRLFGRDGHPTLLVGHPYGLWSESLTTLDRVRSLGLVVQVNGPPASFYGFGTCQVLVFAGPATPSLAPTPGEGRPWAKSHDPAEVERAKRVGYVFVRSVASTAGVDYAAWCEAEGRPLVIVRPKRTRAMVSLYLDHCGRRLTDEACAAVAEMFRATPQQRHALRAWGPSHAVLGGVPLELAETVAWRLYEIARDNLVDAAPARREARP